MSDDFHTMTQIWPTKDGHKPVGAAPGTLTTPPGSPKPVITAIAFGRDFLSETVIEDPKELNRFHSMPHHVWVNVVGLGDAEKIQAVADAMGFHRLATEDVMHLAQRPKMEDYGQYIFITTLIPSFKDHKEFEQLSLFVSAQFLVTFQAYAPDDLSPIAARLREARGVMRSMGPGYLAYQVLDMVVDEYFPILEHFDRQVEKIELDLYQPRPNSPMRAIYTTKRAMMAIRRSMWGMRDFVSVLSRDGHPVLSHDVLPYMRDTYDHVLRIMEMSENIRETAGELTELYYALLSQRLNEVMKVLTIMSTIFIPLTFVVGVYGMNFEHMPELKLHYGYGMVWVVMLLICLSLIWYFRRKGWIGKS